MKRNEVVAIVDGFEVRRQSSKSRNPRHYILVDGRRIWLHHYLANKYIRPLKDGEIVHHKDGNPLNDSINNLEIMTRAEHIRVHKPVKGYRFTEEQRKRLSEAHKGQAPWNKGLSGVYKMSEEAKRKLREINKGRKITWGDKISQAKMKIFKEELLDYLRKNPKATGRELMSEFNFKSYSPIRRCGGIHKLREEAQI